MTPHFLKSLAFTLKYEGGYVNHKYDRGGATYRGVTQRVYDAFRRAKHRIVRGVKLLEDPELHEIYYNDYWIPAGCPKLPPHLATAVFDYAVNSGVSRAVKALQRQVKAGGVDGDFGPKTERAVLAACMGLGGERVVTMHYIAGRKAFFQAIAVGKQRVFLKGWMNRIAGLCQHLNIKL